ncbi:MAG: pyrroline-5-carboxylate reductase [Armatimonadia bacterium]
MSTYQLGVIGTGAMGSALVAAVIRAGAVPANQVLVSDVRPEALEAFAAATGAATTTDNQRVLDECDAILLALKPQILSVALEPLHPRPGQLIISIAAGVSLAKLAGMLGPDQPLVRVMPNILATVGAAASGYAGNALATAEHLAFADRLLSSAGAAVRVDEKLLDAVTGLSGSGPAFVAVFAEALADGGVVAGLPRADAAKLAAQIIMGVGKWLLENPAGPAALKDMVSSPGGTTIAGVRALENGGFRSAAIEAVVAAAQRSREVGS